MARILHVVGNQQFKNSGVGHTVRALTELFKSHGHFVDIVTDSGNIDQFIKELTPADNFYHPAKIQGYSAHNARFSKRDSYCFTRIGNFVDGIFAAIKRHHYDLIIAHTHEAVEAVDALSLHDYVLCVNFTHVMPQIHGFVSGLGIWNEATQNKMKWSIVNSPGIVGTQSDFNQRILQAAGAADVRSLGIPLPDQGILSTRTNARSGVLYLARKDANKGFDDYIKLVKKTGLRAVVLSNDKQKFQEVLQENDITDFVIEEDLTGQAKIDFITQARVAFNPSEFESYGIAFVEMVAQMPTVTYQKTWVGAFNPAHFYVAKNLADAAAQVTRLHAEFPTADSWYATGSTEYVKSLHEHATKSWIDLLTSRPLPTAPSKNDVKATVEREGFLKIADFKPGAEYMEGKYESIFKNAGNFDITHTATDTYFSVKGSGWAPHEDNLFIW